MAGSGAEGGATTDATGPSKDTEDSGRGTGVQEEVQQPVRVLISGAGPAGLMLAHCLLSLGKGKFRVTMYDKAQDPREILKEGVSHRRYSIGLSKRAESCFSLVPGLLGRVKEVTIFADCVSLFLGLGKGPLTTRLSEKDALSAWVVDRVSLCCKLLQFLLDTHGHDALFQGDNISEKGTETGRLDQGNLHGRSEGAETESSKDSSSLLRIRFNCACTAIDLQNRVAKFSPQAAPPLSQGLNSASAGGSSSWGTAGTEGTVIEEHYDLLVGADGLRSAVRAAFVEQVRNFEVEQRVLAGEWAVGHLPCPPGFSRGTLHMFPVVPNSGGINGLAIPSPDGTLCLIWAWLINDDPSSWFACNTPEKAHQYMDSRLPHFRISQEAAWKLRCRPSQTSMHVKCSQYHEPSGHAVLIGDAAHATAPSIGQGANASLVDACVLARLLLGETVRADNRVVDVYSEHSAGGDRGSSQRTFWAKDPSPGVIIAKLPSLLERFSALQVEEGLALVELSGSAGPLAPWARILHGVLFFGRTILCSVLPFLVSPPVMSIAATTAMPYAVIRRKFWLETNLIQWSNNAVRRTCELAKDAVVLHRKLD